MGAVKYDFSGKVVVITGGGTGIGRGVADAFCEAGATVVIAARRLGPLEAFKAAHPGLGDYVQADVSVDADRRRLIDTVVARHGRLDVLMNNAIAIAMGPFGEMEGEGMDAMFAVQLIAPTKLTQLALPHLAKARGCVVNTTSVAGRFVPFPPPGLSVYSAVKAGMNQLTRTLGSELALQGVRVNAVAPGIVRTEASAENVEAAEAIAAMTPMGRMGEPSDIAGVVLWLASDGAGWVTGQVIDASGGWGVSG